MEENLISPSIVQLFKKTIDKYMDEQLKDSEISRLEGVYLSHLIEKDGVSLIELTNAVHLDKANTTRIISDLEVKGYVIRKSNEKDSRKFRIFITEKANAFREKLDSAKKQLNDKVFKGVTKIEKKSFCKVLNKIFDNMRYVND